MNAGESDRQSQIELERRLVQEVKRYRGQWVAVLSHKVIGHAVTPEKLGEKLASEHQPKPERTFRVASGAGATLL